MKYNPELQLHSSVSSRMILLDELVFPAQEYAGKTICGLSKKSRRLPEQPGTFSSMGTAPACI